MIGDYCKTLSANLSAQMRADCFTTEHALVRHFTIKVKLNLPSEAS